MEDFIFIKQESKDSKILLPTGYERDEESITGIYTTSSIRFYKKRLEDLINYDTFKDKDLSHSEIRHLLRYFYACMADFRIKNNNILLKGLGTAQERDYDFKSGLYIVKNNSFMDVVEKKKIGTYLEQYGFDESKEEEVLSNDISYLSRVPNKRLSFRFKN